MAYKVGDVVFFDNPKSWFGLLITAYNLKKYGFSVATHVGIISKVNKNNIVIHEAYSKGFVKNIYETRFISKRIGNGSVFVLRPKAKLYNVEKSCDKYLGRGYSWFDIGRIGFTFVIGFHIFPFGCSRHLICSEAVSRILYDASKKKLNLSAEFNKPYDLITPMDVFISKQIYGKEI